MRDDDDGVPWVEEAQHLLRHVHCAAATLSPRRAAQAQDNTALLGMLHGLDQRKCRVATDGIAAKGGAATQPAGELARTLNAHATMRAACAGFILRLRAADARMHTLGGPIACHVSTISAARKLLFY